MINTSGQGAVPFQKRFSTPEGDPDNKKPIPVRQKFEGLKDFAAAPRGAGKLLKPSDAVSCADNSAPNYSGPDWAKRNKFLSWAGGADFFDKCLLPHYDFPLKRQQHHVLHLPECCREIGRAHV